MRTLSASTPSLVAHRGSEVATALGSPSAYAANGMLALPVTSTVLFVAHNDPVLALRSDCPTAGNSDPSQLASLQHLFICGFFHGYEVEDALKEALAIAKERWARIFNHNRPAAGEQRIRRTARWCWGS